MSSVAITESHASCSSEEEKRAQRLASARRKLNTYRASRSSQHSEPVPPNTASSSSSSKSSSPHASSSSPTRMMPLTTEASINSQFTFPLTHSRASSKGKEKDLEVEVPPAKPASGHRHRRSESQAHRRQRSSVTVPAGASPGQGLSRPTVLGVFDSQQPKEIITTPATPLLDSAGIPNEPATAHDENHEQVAAKLSAFSFGSKPPASTFPPKRRHQPTVPSQSLFAHENLPSTSPLGSPTSSHKLSTPSSRPPSLLLTRASPLPVGSPTAPAPSRSNLASAPSSPPTPARRRHSHTRSNSISLPNLKLGAARPVSFGIATSPSFPSSPCSPSSGGEGALPSRLSGPINGQRLKFEPSGRGAEAEKEREESRRKALDKLTGGSGLSRSPLIEPSVAEISLPDLDDEDTSSVASSNRPLSGAFGSGSGSSFFSRPSSLTLPPLTGSSTSTPSTLTASPFSWSSPADDRSPVERWSGYSFGLQKEYTKEDGLAFGMDLPTAMAKRPSINRQLSALAEVDESEEDEADFADDEIAIGITRTLSDEPESITSPTSAIEPTPSRLRELRLTSSYSSSTPRQSDGSSDSVHSFSFPRQPGTSPSLGSPTKGYGSIGRGRPKPLIGLGSSVSSSSTPTSMSTPRSAGLGGRRRAAPGSGSRGSSISYKKGDSSSSSRDMSIGRVGSHSPTMVSPSPSMNMSSTTFAGWGNVPRASQRPCPRPRQLVGLGIDNPGSGRVLAEVVEGDEDTSSPIPNPMARWHSPLPDEVDSHSPRQYQHAGFGPASEDGGRPSTDLSRDSFADEAQWRDVQFEMEMEREALKEDVELWMARCQSLEDKLEAERKEAAVLRDRVRKLGDRLSSVSSVPTERSSSDSHTTESRLIAEMREQLFNLTASLEHERRAKEVALTKLAESQRYQAGALALRASLGGSEEDELLLTARPDSVSGAGASPVNVASPVPGGYASPSSAAPAQPDKPYSHGEPDQDQNQNQNHDPNLDRIKGWGFPKDPSPWSGKYGEVKPNKRESFFGLSNPLRRTTSADGAEEHNGVDLPPFVSLEVEPAFSTAIATASPFGQLPCPSAQARAVSDPSGQGHGTALRSASGSAPSDPLGGGSGSGMASSAISFLSGYLHHQRPVPVEEASREPRYITKEEQRVPLASEVHQLDFRLGCLCCVGPVIEV